MKDFTIDRQVEIEVNLERGSYIILPRTTGCLCLRKPSQANFVDESEKELPPLLVQASESDLIKNKSLIISGKGDKSQIKKMSTIFESTIEEIFESKQLM